MVTDGTLSGVLCGNSLHKLEIPFGPLVALVRAETARLTNGIEGNLLNYTNI